MKKLKSLKTLSSIGAVVTITPLVAAGCTSANNAKSLDEDKSAIKTSLSSFNWSNGGNYFTSMSDEDVIAEFKKQNPAGVNNLPEDIYDNVNFIIKRVTNTIWQITLNANKDSSSYYGSVFANLNIKTNINDYNWNFDAGNYNALMSEQDVINQFKMVNPAGENGLPEDIYDEKNVDVTANGSGKNWDIYLSTTNSLKYGSSIIKTLSVSGGMIYAGKLYTLAEDIDPNKFCGTDNWIIPTKESGDVTITDHQLLKELCLINNDCTTIGNNFLYQSGIESLDISNISNLKTIGNSFLYNCSYLINLNLPKDTIESINSNFLYNCCNLRGSIDLTSYKETSIPNNFMVNCFNLDSVNLSGLSTVTYIGSEFLTGFLGSLDISGWTSMSDVNPSFLPTTLTSLKMDDWTQIAKITTNFFPSEMNLKTLSLDGWSNVTVIEKDAFPNTITTLNLTGFSSMTTCSRDYWPSSIKSLNLSGWTSMTDCSSSWWPDSVETLNLSGWTSMTKLSNNYFNTNVKSLNISGWTKITRFPANFLDTDEGFKKLENVNFSGLTEVARGNMFTLYSGEDEGPLKHVNLSGCTKFTWKYFDDLCSISDRPDLESLNLTGCVNLDVIPFNSFQMGIENYQLKSLDFSTLTSLYHVDQGCFWNLRALQAMDFSGLISLEEIGDEFFKGWRDMTWIKLPKFKENALAGAVNSHFDNDSDFSDGIFVTQKDDGKNWKKYFSDHGSTHGTIIEQGTGYMTYNGKNYIFPDDIDPNIFCNDGEWVIPTTSGTITIEKFQRNNILTFALPDSGIKTIGNNFLNGCTGLAFLDLSFLSNVTTIGDNFLKDCKTIQNFDLSQLKNVTSIGNNFFSGCSSLSMLDFSSWGKIQSIGSGFLSGCSILIDLKTFNKDPSEIKINKTNFINSINKYCWTIHANDRVDQYKNTSPWNKYANNITE